MWKQYVICLWKSWILIVHSGMNLFHLSQFWMYLQFLWFDFPAKWSLLPPAEARSYSLSHFTDAAGDLIWQHTHQSHHWVTQAATAQLKAQAANVLCATMRDCYTHSGLNVSELKWSLLLAVSPFRQYLNRSVEILACDLPHSIYKHHCNILLLKTKQTYTFTSIVHRNAGSNSTWDEGVALNKCNRIFHKYPPCAPWENTHTVWSLLCTYNI